MAKNLLAGATTFGGGTIIPFGGGNPDNISVGSLVGITASGALTTAQPFVGVLTGTNEYGVQLGIHGVFNVTGVSGAVGSRVTGLPNSIIMSEPFTGHTVNDQQNVVGNISLLALKL